LAELLKQEGQLKRELEDIESEWLAQQEVLEALGGLRPKAPTRVGPD